MADNPMIKPLHGLRGAAALTVVIGHYDGISGTASLGVLLFFLISGFLIGKLYLETDPSAENVWRYTVARVARVYPLFALVIITTGLLNSLTAANVFGLTLDQVPQHLLLAGAASTVWTISAEFQFYAVFVLIWLVRKRIGNSAALVFGLLAVTSLVGLTLGWEAGRIALIKYLHLFVLGLAIAWLCNRDLSRIRGLAALALPLSILGYALVFLLFGKFGNSYYIYQSLPAVIVCAVLLTSCVAAGDCWTNRMLSWPIAIWLGEISFSVYLLHRHSEWMVDALAGAEISHWVTLPIKIGLTLLLAHVTYKLVEVPSRRALRKLGEKAFPLQPSRGESS